MFIFVYVVGKNVSITPTDLAVIEWHETDAFCSWLLPTQLQIEENRLAHRRRHDQRAWDKQQRERPFIAWDGEGVSLPDGSHSYMLLANSTGTYISSDDPTHPLTSQQCFEFILRTAMANKNAYHVGFALGYDTNMMLGDVALEDLQTLYDRGGQWTYCPSVRTHIQFRPHKSIGLRSRAKSRLTGELRYFYARIDDVFTFFNTNFVNACDKYLGKDWPNRALVIEGKGERSTGFQTVDMLPYCQAELQALVLLMNELRNRLVYVGIRPSAWHGPGAIASKILQEHNIKEYIGKIPARIDIPLRHAEAGGRFELVQYGCTQEETWRYDRRSAYPFAMCTLPSAKGRWRYVKAPTDAQTLGIYRVEWHCDRANGRYPQPFHFRRDDGHLMFPPHVEGWYWNDEVTQALRLPYGQCELLEAYTFEPYSDELPFAFMREYYELRQDLIRQGHPAQLAVKLAINSVYGKLIQQLGWYLDHNGTLHAPAYFSLLFASRITSVTRAALMQVMIDNDGYDDLISFETDALFSRKRWSNVDVGTELGQWEEMALHNLVYIQSGVYACDEIPHVRGMTRIAWPHCGKHVKPESDCADCTRAVIDRFRQMLATRFEPYEYKLQAFVGLGTGLTQDMDKWRKWIKLDRKLQTMEPSLGINKRNHDVVLCPCHDNDTAQLDIWHTTRVWPTAYEDQIQRAYDIGWKGELHEVFDPSEVEGSWE